MITFIDLFDATNNSEEITVNQNILKCNQTRYNIYKKDEM